MNSSVILLVVLQIFLTVFANLSLKISAEKGVNIASFGGVMQNYHLLMAASFFTASFVTYFLILQKAPLNFAQSLVSLQYVAVILGAHFVLNEPISTIRWMGIGMICIGILIVSRTA